MIKNHVLFVDEASRQNQNGLNIAVINAVRTGLETNSVN